MLTVVNVNSREAPVGHDIQTQYGDIVFSRYSQIYVIFLRTLPGNGRLIGDHNREVSLDLDARISNKEVGFVYKRL